MILVVVYFASLFLVGATVWKLVAVVKVQQKEICVATKAANRVVELEHDKPFPIPPACKKAQSP